MHLYVKYVSNKKLSEDLIQEKMKSSNEFSNIVNVNYQLNKLKIFIEIKHICLKLREQAEPILVIFY